MIIGYTTGVYDMFHIGHLNIIKKAKKQCDFLIVGVSTDELVEKDKNKTPIIPFEERCEIVKSIRYVDQVVPQIDKNKFDAWEKYHFDKMFVGSDWKGTDSWIMFEKQFSPIGVEIIYLDYTDGISSTILRDRLVEKYGKKQQRKENSDNQPFGDK
ncbi:MAG: adenylyltransferase/cytidyltransferase family protein [Dorea sp.]|nr:adenylyltransferase/cytidyltransferase family protein [Dorea sp.]